VVGGEALPERISHSLVKALRSVPDFSSLDDHALLRIVGASANLFWPAGSIIFEKGSPSEALFVVLSGRVQIFERLGDREVEVTRVEPGSSFGEISLMLNTTHTKDARALEDAELMVVPKGSFQELLDSNPDLAAQFQRRIAERLPVAGEVAAEA
jgi:CRP-like cAMP-binding protein